MNKSLTNSKTKNYPPSELLLREKTALKNTMVPPPISKPFLGLVVANTSPVNPVNDSTLKDGTNNPPLVKKSTCLEEIERLKQNREERRKKMHDIKKQKTERELMNEAHGIKVDVDFQVMVESNMQNVQQMVPVSYSASLLIPLFQHIPADQLKICVCIKKRPIFQ